MRKDEIINLSDRQRKPKAITSTSGRGYSPEKTQAVRQETIREIVGNALDLLQKAPTRVDLRDVQAVQARVEVYLQHCCEYASLPSFSGIAAALGYSRRHLYRFWNENPQSQTSEYIDRLRSAFDNARIAATDRGAAAESVTIFLLKNSNEGYADRVEVQPIEPAKPFEGLSEETLRQKYLSDITEAGDFE